jgi:hypothetical protein
VFGVHVVWLVASPESGLARMQGAHSARCGGGRLRHLAECRGCERHGFYSGFPLRFGFSAGVFSFNEPNPFAL